MAEMRETLASGGDLEFLMFHDASQYFETRFDISAAGAISLGDASDPSPARVEEVRTTVTELGVTCMFSGPTSSNLFEVVGLDDIGIPVAPRFVATCDACPTPLALAGLPIWAVASGADLRLAAWAA